MSSVVLWPNFIEHVDTSLNMFLPIIPVAARTVHIIMAGRCNVTRASFSSVIVTLTSKSSRHDLGNVVYIVDVGRTG